MDFKLQLLEDITDNFSDEHIVGSGGYGNVYRGVYDGEEIALKRLHQQQGLDDKAFCSEFLNLSKVRHPNIVRLIGYCHESRKRFLEHNGETILASVRERVLCFEYMPGGSLDAHISDESCDLAWPTCYKIIKGASEGLNHLHYAQAKPILHLDLKPHNILLDKDMTAKIADLGLSRLVTSSETRKTEARNGTYGYMPPEYMKSGFISKKFDVFSLGVIIIKIVAGNKGYFRHSEMPQEQFIERVTKKWKDRLQGTSRYSSQEEEKDIFGVRTCVKIALRCVVDDRKNRPRIKEIMAELKELEAEIEKMSLSYAQSKDQIGQRSSDSNVLGVDPSKLRFLFEPGKDITCCLELTNKTDGFIAYNTKINQTNYCTKPSKGIIPPRSNCDISVKLRAQEVAPAANVQCHDMFLVQSFDATQDMTSDDITEDFFEKATMIDELKLPIVFVDL